VLANLIPNAAAALRQRGGGDRSTAAPHLVVRVSGADGRATVEVEDPLPLVADDFWAVSGTSLHRLSERLAERGGRLQQLSAPGGKVVRAEWPSAEVAARS
jgi:hypothetical protein